MSDINAISSAISSVPAVKPQQVASQQPAAQGATPPSKNDIVTISAQGKQAVQAPYSPSEEQKEPAALKAREAQAGKK